ncbi:hypothetical protein B0H65DRAFT_432406 [Neurospora tetraspora]|uniref:Uncharacterized protein n=1 Tax=Neurospora tetraspora TaxID=94610 RepID=A0AAE0MP35_9PEZI|nr:hypothetical protein B0H65DRAFT_432406 [Neurospora tetraspora]
MIEVGELKNTFSGRQPLVWTKGTVDDFVHELFEPQTSQNLERGKFGRLFTAQNLALIAGFRVELTTNLADHLLFRDSDKTVMIFHHATFLSHQLGNTIFPPDFVSETLDTLALLFPQNDAASRKWYRKQGERSELDMAVLNCGSRHRRTRLEEYHYWHDRLLILKEEFDEARPTTIAQWWNDRRDGIQWYSLWIVMGLTLFFGLVQSIEGAVQVYQGMKSSGG